MNRLEEAEAYALTLLTRDNDDRAMKDLERIKKQIADGDVTWSGNCEEDCGWDGLSYRCRCGNRRVYWEWWDSVGAFVSMEY